MKIFPFWSGATSSDEDPAGDERPAEGRPAHSYGARGSLPRRRPVRDGAATDPRGEAPDPRPRSPSLASPSAGVQDAHEAAKGPALEIRPAIASSPGIGETVGMVDPGHPLAERDQAGLDQIAAVLEALRPGGQVVPQGPGPLLSELGAFGLMSTNIAATSQIQGFIGSCLVDSESGLLLASEGGEDMDMEAEAALNTMVVKAETEVIEVLDLEDHIEDILITMTKQLHFIRPLEKAPGVFLYVALDKKAANLGMARMQVKRVETGLSV